MYINGKVEQFDKRLCDIKCNRTDNYWFGFGKNRELLVRCVRFLFEKCTKNIK